MANKYFPECGYQHQPASLFESAIDFRDEYGDRYTLVACYHAAKGRAEIETVGVFAKDKKLDFSDFSSADQAIMLTDLAYMTGEHLRKYAQDIVDWDPKAGLIL